MEMDIFPKQALSISEFCKQFSVGRTKVYSEISAGRLAVKKVGRRTIITAQAAESWLASLPEGSA